MRLAGILLIVIGVMGAGGYWYYNDTQARLSILTANNAKLETAVQLNEDTIKTMAADFAAANAQLKRVNAEFAAIQQQNRVLADKLARHDLGVLGAGKPGLVENVINKATDKVGRCFELLSGAQLTDSERNAENANAFNSECPWYYDTLVVPGRMLNENAPAN
tara:strand:+ start:81 stop:569 length:489 start_codon:yes stop_codon:yes gene_type:complete